MKEWQVLIVVAIVVLIQGSLSSNLVLSNVVPDVSLGLVVVIALFNGSKLGLKAGLVAGLLQDLLFGRLIGLYALGKLLTGYFIGESSNFFFKENIIVPFLLTAVATVVYESFLYLFSGVLYATWGIGFIPHVFKVTAYNACVATAIYVLWKRIDTISYT